MSSLFDEDYYQQGEITKPVFSDSDDDLISKLFVLDRVWDSWGGIPNLDSD